MGGNLGNEGGRQYFPSLSSVAGWVAGDDVPSARFGHEMDSKYSFMIK